VGGDVKTNGTGIFNLFMPEAQLRFAIAMAEGAFIKPESPRDKSSPVP
jgi:hypothetical protein